MEGAWGQGACSTEVGPTAVLPRNPFSDRMREEYRKTAEAVGKRPWSMGNAKAYLLQMLRDNVEGACVSVG